LSGRARAGGAGLLRFDGVFDRGGALRRVAEAIDRLEADRQNTDAADLEARVAAVWSMVSEIDPELARLASGYDKPG
jgi:hypothetical protein